MKIPLSIFVGAFEQLNSGVTWAEIAQNWELYSENWDKGATNLESPLLDLFNDESITIKDVLKDLSDPGKLFTEFSRSFEVPASKKNNKIFKHYYNIDLETTIDSRSLIPAAILMNGVDYKIGNLSVEGIKMSNGKPMSYKVRFFGKLSEIARRIGEDKLNILDFTAYDESAFDAKASFASSLESDLVFPLASRSDRYIVDSVDATAAVGIENTRNIRYVDVTRRGEDYGISDDNVIGALKVGRILDSIENLYGITFSGAVRQNYISNLYLWLHRVDKNRSGSEVFEGSVGNFTVPLQDSLSNTLGEWIGSTSSILRWSIASNNKAYLIRFKGTSSADFNLKMLFNGSEKANSTVTTAWSNYIDVQEYQNITFSGTSTAASTLTVNVEVKEIDYNVLSNPETIFTTSGSISLGGSGEYKVSSNLPDMKISEFLGSVFKMFNVVAEVSDALDVFTSHQEAYMSTGVVKNVSEFIDVDNWEVNKPNLYNSIKFSFAEPKTVLEYGYNKVNGKPYGELSYELIGAEGNKLSGEEFEINLKNQRIPGENVTDQNDKSLSGIVYYQFSDIKGAEQTIKPIFSYITPVSVNTSKAIAWDNGAAVESITSYVMPSSVYTNHTPIVSGVTPVYSGLYFDEEIEELSNSPYNGIGLWSMHYRGITAAMFEERRRQVVMTARFSQSIIRNLKLSDTLYIHNNYYTINSVDTNFLTGESVLDLNLIPYNAPREYKVIEETIDNATAGVLTYIDADTGFAKSEYIATPNSLLLNRRIGDIRYKSFGIAEPAPDFVPTVIVGLGSKTDAQITINGTVTNVGQPAYTTRGFYWVAGTGTPTAADNVLTIAGTGTGIYSDTITGLVSGNSYTFVAWATNTVGTAVSAPLTITTVVVSTSSVTTDGNTPSLNSATLYGTVTNVGYPVYTSKGFCYIQGAGTPTTANSTVVSAGNSSGSFFGVISGLTIGTLYSYRAYMIQNGITYYGATATVTTATGDYAGVVQTNAPTYDTNSATLNGTVTDVGIPGYQTKGFWFAPGPVVPNSGNTEYIVSGTAAGAFSQVVTGLTPLTTYSIRTWTYDTTNGYGLGNVINFTTTSDLSLATVTTYVPTFSQADAVFYGNIDYVGNPNYTEKGFYWAAGSVNPTSADTTYTVAGTAGGAFQSGLITGLSASTTYSVRAYAINSQGTAYGATQVFTTEAVPTCSSGTLYFDGGVVTGVNATVGTGSLAWGAGDCSSAMTEVSINITNNESAWQSAEQITSVVMKEGATVINDYTVTVYFSAGLMQLKINGNFPDVNNDVDHNYTFVITASAITLNNIAINLPSTNAVSHTSVAVTKNGDTLFPASRDDTAFNNVYLEPVGEDGDAFEYTITYTADSNYEFTGTGNIQPTPTTDNASVSVSTTSYTASTITITVSGNIQAVSESANLSWGGTALALPATVVTTQEYRFGTSGSWITYPSGGIDIGTGGQIIQLRVVPDGSVYFAQGNTNLIDSFDPAYDYSGDPVVISCTMNSFTGGEGNLTTLLGVYPRASATFLAAFRFDYFDAL